MYTACPLTCTGQTRDIGYKEDFRRRIWPLHSEFNGWCLTVATVDLPLVRLAQLACMHHLVELDHEVVVGAPESWCCIPPRRQKYSHPLQLSSLCSPMLCDVHNKQYDTMQLNAHVSNVSINDSFLVTICLALILFSTSFSKTMIQKSLLRVWGRRQIILCGFCP